MPVVVFRELKLLPATAQVSTAGRNASLHRKALPPFLRPDLAPKPILAGHSYDCEGTELSVP